MRPPSVHSVKRTWATSSGVTTCESRGGRAAAGLVTRVGALGDHAFEPELLADREGLRAIVACGWCLPRGAAQRQILEQAAALRVGRVGQEVAVEPKEIEHHVADGHLPGD